MPSFDVVSRVDLQEVDNTINNTRKAIMTRYDFRGSKTELLFDRKEKKINIHTEDKMKLDAVTEMLRAAAVKRGLDLKSLKFGDPVPSTGMSLRCEVKIKEGIEQEAAKKLVKLIKDAKLKVQASIQGDELRITGKQRDDLQQAIALLKGSGAEVPLQFVNMKE
ncbi:MAG: YajQ family cyclic di-GMP-binding protein [Planctomycetota bacterium]|nr:YajQ family cyclic di-GMP-binding protein [Planctomycetota bacterium]